MSPRPARHRRLARRGSARPAFIVRVDFPEVPDRTVRPEQVEAEVRRLREAVDYVGGPPARPGPAGAAARRTRGVAHLRRPDPHGAGRGVPDVGRDADPQQLSSAPRRPTSSRRWSYRNLGPARRGCASAWPTSTPSSSGCSTGCWAAAGHELWSIPADEQVIVVAHELSPGLTVQLDREHVVGLISEEGTRTAHAAILAHSLGIPAVMGAAGALAAIPPRHDGPARRPGGTIVLDPDPRRARGGEDAGQPTASARAPARGRRRSAGGHARRPADHADGQRGPAGGDRDRGADGRAGRRPAPHRVSPDRPCRAADRDRAGRLLPAGRGRVPRPYGHDPLLRPRRRQVPGRVQGARPRRIPSSGWRSIRVCLDEPDVFRPQVRAVLRAAVGPRHPAHAAAGHAGRGGGGGARHRAGGGRGAPASGRARGASRCRSA